MRNRFLSSAVVMTWSIASASYGTVLRVPEEYPTIAAALQAGGGPNTIIELAPGSYDEAVYLNGYFALRSVNPADPDVVDATILELSVGISANPDVTVRLQGLTIRGGTEINQISDFGRVILEDCVFDGSEVGVHPNANLVGDLFVQRCSFIGCTWGILSESPVVEVRDSVFTDNVIGVAGAVREIRACDISGNFLAGLSLFPYFNGPNLPATVRRNLIADNWGAGLETAADQSVTATDNMIVNNDVGIDVLGPLAAHNDTIVANDAAGVAIADGASAMIRNSIIHTNGVNVTVASGAADITYSCMNVVAAGEGNFAADPLFVNPAARDYHLADGSPCVNRGPQAYDFGISVNDIDGDLRVRQGRIDVGADESPFEGAPEPAIAGDCNMDGAVDGLDIQCLVDALLAP